MLIVQFTILYWLQLNQSCIMSLPWFKWSWWNNCKLSNKSNVLTPYFNIILLHILYEYFVEFGITDTVASWNTFSLFNFQTATIMHHNSRSYLLIYLHTRACACVCDYFNVFFHFFFASFHLFQLWLAI